MRTEVLAFLALPCGFLAGMSAAARLKQRETALLETRQFLLALKLSLEFSGAPLSALLYALAEDERFRSLSFLQSLFRRLADGAALPAAWQKAAKDEEKRLGPAGAALLGRLGSLLGTTDKPGQLEVFARELAALD